MKHKSIVWIKQNIFERKKIIQANQVSKLRAAQASNINFFRL